MQIRLADRTAERIEAVTGKKFTRGADALINEVIDQVEGIEPGDHTPRVVMCAGMKGALENVKE